MPEKGEARATEYLTLDRLESLVVDVYGAAVRPTAPSRIPTRLIAPPPKAPDHAFLKGIPSETGLADPGGQSCASAGIAEGAPARALRDGVPFSAGRSKRKLVILNYLFAGPQRFGELRRLLPSITQRMLTRQLRELEANGLIVRTVYREVPPKVEYSLTTAGRSLEDIADQLDRWGRWYRDTQTTQSTGNNLSA